MYKEDLDFEKYDWDVTDIPKEITIKITKEIFSNENVEKLLIELLLDNVDKYLHDIGYKEKGELLIASTIILKEFLEASKSGNVEVNCGCVLGRVIVNKLAIISKVICKDIKKKETFKQDEWNNTKEELRDKIWTKRKLEEKKGRIGKCTICKSREALWQGICGNCIKRLMKFNKKSDGIRIELPKKEIATYTFVEQGRHEHCELCGGHHVKYINFFEGILGGDVNMGNWDAIEFLACFNCLKDALGVLELK
jgi:hypothetical protein